MKQRVIVQAIVSNNDEVLFLRRSQGRAGIVGKYELPGGTIEDNEQPDDAMHRHIRNDLGVDSNNILLKLHDTMSLTDREEGNIQHIFIVYKASGISHETPLRLGQSYDEFKWIKSSKIQHKDLRDSAFYLLNIAESNDQKNNINNDEIKTDDKNTAKKYQAILYSDGGSRGNPGPSAAAFVIMVGENVVDQGGEFLGITTNNQAEYHGVRLGLERAIQRGIASLEFRIDSMLVVNQLNGLYSIKNRELWPINERIQSLLKSFDRVDFKHVPRELNGMADALVNKYLDEHTTEEK